MGNEIISITRYILPIFLKESIISINYNKGIITYKVDNPSIVTCYPVYDHLGIVHFVYNNNNNNIDMIWNVTVLPYQSYIFKQYIQLFTSSIITTLSRNFLCYLIEQHQQQQRSSIDTNNLIEEYWDI